MRFTDSEKAILVWLYQNKKGRATVIDISIALNKKYSFISIKIKRLLQYKLIQKDAITKRSQNVLLTVLGYKLARDLNKAKKMLQEYDK